MHYQLPICFPPHPNTMDDIEVSPEDIAMLDEDTTSVIPETPNTIGQSLVKRLGLTEAEAASNFLNTFCMPSVLATVQLEQ